MMTTLVAQQANPSFRAPDMVWIAHWNGDPSTASPYVPAELWNNHQRIHQYRGGHVEIWGGVAINIDNDAVDAAVAPSTLATEGTFVMATGRPELWRITGGAPVHVSSWEALGLAPQPVAVLSQSQFDALPRDTGGRHLPAERLHGAHLAGRGRRRGVRAVLGALRRTAAGHRCRSAGAGPRRHCPALGPAPQRNPDAAHDRPAPARHHRQRREVQLGEGILVKCGG